MPRRISAETAARIAEAWPALLQAIAGGATLPEAAADHGLTQDQVAAYYLTDEALRAEWNDARRNSADALADEALATARNRGLDPSHARVLTDTLKWAAAKRNPDHYSERTRVDVRQTVDFKDILTRAEARLAQLRHAALEAQDAQILPALQLDSAAQGEGNQ